MNNFIALIKGGMSRSKGILITAVAASVGIAIISLASTNIAGSDIGAIKLGFIDNDGSAASTGLARYLEEDLGIALVLSDSVDMMNTELVEKRISGLIEVPDGFEASLLSGRPAPAELTFMDDYANAAFTRGYIDSYMQSIGAMSVVVEGDAAAYGKLLADAQKERVPVETIEKDTGLQKEQADKTGYRLMLSNFMMIGFIMTISIALMLFTDRMEGTYRRIKAGRVTSFQYVSSIAAIGVLLMLLLGVPSLILYSLSGADPGVPTAATAGVLGAFSLFAIAFGVFVGVMMPSFGSILAVTVAAGTIMPMLGGAWFPIDLAPEFMRTLGRGMPHYWVFEAVGSWQTGEGSPAGPMLIVLLTAALFFILAGVRFTGSKGLARV